MTIHATTGELKRDGELNDYLASVRRAGDVSAETANRAWNAWMHLSEASQGMLPVPDASPGPNGELLYTWDKVEHHLELEISAEGSAELFYRNRITGQLWGADYIADAPLAPDIRAKLALLSAFYG